MAHCRVKRLRCRLLCRLRVCIHVALQERAAQLVRHAGVEIEVAGLLGQDGNTGVVGKAGLALRGAVFFVATSSPTFVADS